MGVGRGEESESGVRVRGEGGGGEGGLTVIVHTAEPVDENGPALVVQLRLALQIAVLGRLLGLRGERAADERRVRILCVRPPATADPSFPPPSPNRQPEGSPPSTCSPSRRRRCRRQPTAPHRVTCPRPTSPWSASGTAGVRGTPRRRKRWTTTTTTTTTRPARAQRPPATAPPPQQMRRWRLLLLLLLRRRRWPRTTEQREGEASASPPPPPSGRPHRGCRHQCGPLPHWLRRSWPRAARP
jgi:hypothetical protein